MERGEQSENWMQDLLDIHPGTSISADPRSAYLTHGVIDSRFIDHASNMRASNSSLLQHYVQAPPSQTNLSSVSTRQMPLNVPSQPVSDRSAWSHLLSLDPSLANYQISSSNQVPASLPYGHSLFEMSSLSTSRPAANHIPAVSHHLNLVNESLPLSSVNVPLSRHSIPYSAAIPNSSSFTQKPTSSPLNQSTGGLPQNMNHLIGLSHNPTNFSSSPPVSRNIQSSVDLLDQGGYSPVSPPHDADTPPSSLPNISTAPLNLLKREPPPLLLSNLSAAPDSNLKYLPGQHSDRYLKTQSYQSSVNLPDPSLSNSILKHPSMQSQPYSAMSAFDMPLDMTKVFNSSDEAQDMTLSKKANPNPPLPTKSSPTVISAAVTENFTSSSSFNNDAKDFLQHPTKTSMSVSSLHNPAVVGSKPSKPIARSCPKKSNFYGRDASLFSFQSEPPSQPQSSMFQSAQPKVIDMASTLLPTSTALDNPLRECEKISSPIPFVSSVPVNSTFDSISPDYESTFADSFIDASTRVCDSTDSSTLQPNVFPPSNSYAPSSLVRDLISDTSVPAGSMPSGGAKSTNVNVSIDLTGDDNLGLDAQHNNSMDSHIGALSTDLSSMHTQSFGSVKMNDILPVSTLIDSPYNVNIAASQEEGVPMATTPSEAIGNSDLEEAPVEDFSDSEDAAPAPIVPAKTVSRKKKKKGVATGAKQRKRGKKMAAAIPAQGPPEYFDGTAAVPPGVEFQPQSRPVKVKAVKPRRTRKVAASKEEPEEEMGEDTSTPRRSSSRKSKANALRLIELQADSNYGFNSPMISDESTSLPPLSATAVVAKKPRAPRVKKSKLTPVTKVDDLSDASSLSSGETTLDEQDAEYAPDGGEEEELQKELQEDLALAEESNKKNKRVGGLKISIKLGTENLAEIVSGVRNQSLKSKSKVVPKKATVKSKFKSQAFIEEDEQSCEEETDEVLPTNEVSNLNSEDKSIVSGSDTTTTTTELGSEIPKVASTPNAEDEKIPNAEDKEKSLLEKYFSAASAVSKQVNLEKNAKKLPPVKKKKVPVGRTQMSKSANSEVKKKIIPKKKGVTGKKGKQQLNEGESAKTEIKQEDSSAGGEAPKFVCGYCPKKYHNKEELMSHMETHLAEMESKSGEKNSPDLKKLVSTDASKKVKIQTSSEVQESKSVMSGANRLGSKKSESIPEHKCGECSKVFPSKSSLLEHMSNHTEEKPFECNLCHKCFKDRELLSAHRKTHNKDKLVRCPICSKGFIHEPDLVNHIRTHPKRSNPVIPLKRKIQSSSASSIAKIAKISPPAQPEVNQPCGKPTSFASALSGSGLNEKSSGKVVNKNPTVLLKKSDASIVPIDRVASSSSSKQPPTTKTQTGSVIQSQKSTKLSSPSIVNPKTPSSTGVSVKGTPEAIHVSASKENGKKSDDIETSKNIGDGKKDSGGQLLTTAGKSDSGVCDCKECPECVTRFLQSFY